jgi:hypothetical protein
MCFKCFIRMLQVFRLDVAKVDLDISVLQMLILLTLTFDSRCCKCSFCMLHILFSNVEDVFFECWGILLYVARNKTRNITWSCGRIFFATVLFAFYSARSNDSVCVPNDSVCVRRVDVPPDICVLAAPLYIWRTWTQLHRLFIWLIMQSP